MFQALAPFLVRPPLYAPGTNQFWNDEYISHFVLESHLNPDVEAASRCPDFVDESVAWIARMAPASRYGRLLDLGCGPGLYAERFAKEGYRVTGVDFSKRSIEYAQELTDTYHSNISYVCQNYLTLDEKSAFDLVTLIYCDFGVLSTTDRAILLSKVHTALKPGGKFILDVFTPAQHQGRPEAFDWTYHSDGGFWDVKPHLCLNSFYRYDEDDTVLTQAIVVNEDNVECYNIWEHCFTQDELRREAKAAGFTRYEWYSDVTGKPYDENGTVICAVLTK